MSGTDIDLDAIRERDRRWQPRGVRTEAPERDRRDLLQYIQELEELTKQIDGCVQAIKRVHRDGYQAKPQCAPEETEPE